MPLVFPFDPDIARAATVPARPYNDPVYLELERERVFAHSGQLVGRTERLAALGDYVTAEVGNDSIVIVRGADGLREFHNVCRRQMQTNVVLPPAHDRTRVVFEWYAADPPADPAADERWSRLVAFSDEIVAARIPDLMPGPVRSVRFPLRGAA